MEGMSGFTIEFGNRILNTQHMNDFDHVIVNMLMLCLP